MISIKEMSRLTGVTPRALRYYDSIGLLKPSKISSNGYRMYDNADIEKMSQILVFKELDFSLEDIKSILDKSEANRDGIINSQIELLNLKKDRLEKIIEYSELIKKQGVNAMNFEVFDSNKIKEYEKKAKDIWGNTEAYKEYEKNSANRSDDKRDAVSAGLMNIFCEFGEIKSNICGFSSAQSLVEKLKNYITKNYYTCTNEILLSLGQMYAAGGEFTENIDKAGGQGTAEFVNEAIIFYCKNN